MAKIIITSDWHLEPGIYVSICLDFIDYLVDFSIRNELKYVIIAGDIFEKSSKIKNEAFLPLFRKFQEIKATTNLEIIIVLGNHDVFNDKNESVVEVFSPFGKVIQDFETITIDGKTIDLLAYTKDETKLPKNDHDYLITHLGIVSFAFDNGYECDEKLFFSPELFKNYKKVFSGHLHRFQHKKNIVYQGSPYQTSTEEEGQKKGFIVFDTDDGSWNFIEYENSPKYITVTAEQIVSGIDLKNKFVSVKITEKLDNFVQLKHMLYDKGAIDVKPVFVKEEDDFDVLKDGIEFKVNDNIERLLEEHIKSIKIEGIDNNRLLKILGKIKEEL